MEQLELTIPRPLPATLIPRTADISGPRVSRILQMATQLGRPVARGLLTVSQAEAAIMVAVVRADHLGQLCCNVDEVLQLAMLRFEAATEAHDHAV